MLQQHRVINLEDNTQNQPSKLRTNTRVEKNDGSLVTYKTNCQIEFETSMLKSNLCDYTHAYILIKGTISIVNKAG